MKPALALTALLLGCRHADPTPPSAIVLVIDGVRTDELSGEDVSDLTGVPGAENAPGTWGAFVGGAVVPRVYNTGPTITAPAHVAMLTGQVRAFANFSLSDPEDVGEYRPDLPGLLEETRAQLGLDERGAVLLANTTLLAGVQDSLYPGAQAGSFELVTEAARYELGGHAQVVRADDPDPGTDAGVVDAIVARVAADAPRLIVVNLHDVDRAGHLGLETGYLDAIEHVDGLVAGLMDRLREVDPGYAENLLLVVTSDHGRHREGDDEAPWSDHGDTCDGCREVPLFLLGGGARRAELEGPISTLDVAPTVAAHLGVTLPWSRGRPLTPLFDGLAGVTPAGEVDVVASGGRVASRVLLDGFDARSEVRVDGVAVSTPGVWAAEAPTLLSGTRDWVCFREHAPADVDAGWTLRCLTDDGAGWVDIGGPRRTIAPFARVALAEGADGLWAAWPENPRGVGDLDRPDGIGLAVARWTPATGWRDVGLYDGAFPTDAVIVPSEGGAIAAVAMSGVGSSDPRRHRYVSIVRATAEGIDSPAAYGLYELGDDNRVERPALTMDGDIARLGVLVALDGVVHVAAATGQGDAWSTAWVFPDTGDVFPHLSPRWDGNALVWGVLVDGEAHLCRAELGDEPACVGVGSPRIDSFSVEDGVATVSRDAGVGAWELATVRW